MDGVLERPGSTYLFFGNLMIFLCTADDAEYRYVFTGLIDRFQQKGLPAIMNRYEKLTTLER